MPGTIPWPARPLIVLKFPQGISPSPLGLAALALHSYLAMPQQAMQSDMCKSPPAHILCQVAHHAVPVHAQLARQAAL